MQAIYDQKSALINAFGLQALPASNFENIAEVLLELAKGEYDKQDYKTVDALMHVCKDDYKPQLSSYETKIVLRLINQIIDQQEQKPELVFNDIADRYGNKEDNQKFKAVKQKV